MSYMSKKTAVALGFALVVSVPAHAVDNLTVDGYAKSSSGSPVTDSSGECVRTKYEDSKEFLEKCGYKKVVTETVEVDNQPAGAGVAVIEETAIVKEGQVLAAKEEIVAEAFIQNLEFGFDNDNLSARLNWMELLQISRRIVLCCVQMLHILTLSATRTRKVRKATTRVSRNAGPSQSPTIWPLLVT